jgi:very-short-patch-repair endonuclease
MRTDKDEVFARMVDFVKTARHTPCYEEILEVGEASATWARSLGWDVGTIFEAAGRKNKSLFASKFEERVYYSLIDLGLTDEQLERQKKFPGLFTISARWPLRFDFYIEHLNILVEADGEQHEEDYDSTKYLFDGDAVKASDKLKEAYAEEHGISLVRIPYSPYFKKVSKTVSQQLSPFIR